VEYEGPILLLLFKVGRGEKVRKKHLLLWPQEASQYWTPGLAEPIRAGSPRFAFTPYPLCDTGLVLGAIDRNHGCYTLVFECSYSTVTVPQLGSGTVLCSPQASEAVQGRPKFQVPYHMRTVNAAKSIIVGYANTW
jgi:hypothetical protein